MFHKIFGDSTQKLLLRGFVFKDGNSTQDRRSSPPIGMTGAAMESHYKEELLAIVWSPRGGSSAAGEEGPWWVSAVLVCGVGW